MHEAELPQMPDASADPYRGRWGVAWDTVYRFVYSRVQNREEAEDLTQEVCARVLRRQGASNPGSPDTPTTAAVPAAPEVSPSPAAPLTPPAPSPAYLRAAALNLLRDRWRRRRSTGVLSPLEEAWLVADDGADPGGRLLDRLWLRGLLDRLPADQRQVVELRIIQGLSRAETAARMGRSEASVRGLQYRAIQALREMALAELGAGTGAGTGAGARPADPADTRNTGRAGTAAGRSNTVVDKEAERA